MAVYGELYAVLYVLLWQISDISYTQYNALLTYSHQVMDRSISPALDVLISCNNSIFLFSVSSYWFDVPKTLYRVLVIPLFASSCGVFVYGVSLLFAHLLLVPLALITPCQSVIIQYLHLVREFPSAQFTQHRCAVLIVPCSLFAC